MERPLWQHEPRRIDVCEITRDASEIVRTLYTAGCYWEAMEIMRFLVHEKHWPVDRLSIVDPATQRHLSFVL